MTDRDILNALVVSMKSAWAQHCHAGDGCGWCIWEQEFSAEIMKLSPPPRLPRKLTDDERDDLSGPLGLGSH